MNDAGMAPATAAATPDLINFLLSIDRYPPLVGYRYNSIWKVNKTYRLNFLFGARMGHPYLAQFIKPIRKEIYYPNTGYFPS